MPRDKFLGGISEVVTDVLWDRPSLEFGVFRFFENAQNSPLRGNMRLPRQLPNPQRFTFYEVGIAILAGGKLLPLNHRLWWNSIFELQINQKSYVSGPLHVFADPTAIAAMAIGESGKLSALPTDQLHALLDHGRFRLDAQITIESGELFHAEILTRPTEKETPPPECEAILMLLGNRERGAC